MPIQLTTIITWVLAGYVFTSMFFNATTRYERKKNTLHTIMLAMALALFVSPLLFVYQFLELGATAHAELLCYGVGCFAFLYADNASNKTQKIIAKSNVDKEK